MQNALVMLQITLFGWFAFLTDLNRVSILTWFRPTTITARPHHLVLIQLIFPLAAVPGRLFPCYFRRTIKHCGINNGLTSSQDFFTSCLQKAWGKKKKFTGELCCSRFLRKTQCEPRCSHQLLDIIHCINDTVRKGTCFLYCQLELEFLLSISVGWFEPPGRLFSR